MVEAAARISPIMVVFMVLVVFVFIGKLQIKVVFQNFQALLDF